MRNRELYIMYNWRSGKMEKKVSEECIRNMIHFFEAFEKVPFEDRKILEKAYQNSPENPCHYASGEFSYQNYRWRIDTLKAILARMEKESNRVKAYNARRRY